MHVKNVNVLVKTVPHAFLPVFLPFVDSNRVRDSSSVVYTASRHLNAAVLQQQQPVTIITK